MSGEEVAIDDGEATKGEGANHHPQVLQAADIAHSGSGYWLGGCVAPETEQLGTRECLA